MNIPSYKSNHDVRIWNLGDLHRGNRAFCKPLLDRAIAEIRNDPHSFWVSTGDLFETNLKDAVGVVYDASSTDCELYALRDEIHPIWHKCLGVVSGNHEFRMKKAAGLDLDRLFCNLVNGKGGDPKYLGDMGLIRVVAGGAAYYIAMHHGFGFGRKMGSKVNNLQEFSTVLSGADVYMTGHTHSFVYLPDVVQYIDKKRCLWSEYTAHFVTTGHCMDWKSSYAQKLMLKAKPMGFAVITLKASLNGRNSDKKVAVDLFG